MFNVHQGIAYYILATNVKKSSARRVIWKDIVLQSMKAKHITKTIFKRRNQTSHNPVLIFEIGIQYTNNINVYITFYKM